MGDKNPFDRVTVWRKSEVNTKALQADEKNGWEKHQHKTEIIEQWPSFDGTKGWKARPLKGGIHTGHVSGENGLQLGVACNHDGTLVFSLEDANILACAAEAIMLSDPGEWAYSDVFKYTKYTASNHPHSMREVSNIYLRRTDGVTPELFKQEIPNETE